MSEELIARKHWIVYVGPAFRLAVTAAIIWLLAQLAIANGLVDDPFLVQAFAAAMLAFTATTSLYRVLLLASVRWSATPQRVDLARVFCRGRNSAMALLMRSCSTAGTSTPSWAGCSATLM